jgi:hypothetical protein
MSPSTRCTATRPLVYPENNRFWRCLWDTAVHIAVADEAPSKWEMAKDSIKDSVVNLPDTIKTVAGKGADAIADTAQAAGRVVNAAGKGLFSGVGTPILIGAGVLGAVLLLRRGRRARRRRSHGRHLARPQPSALREASSPADPDLARTPRVWPLAAINGRAPVVLDERCAELRGVDLAYPRLDPADAIASCPIDTPYGTATHLMPAMTSALAIDDGEITFAGRLGHGFGLIINHGNGWASHYANLQAVVAIRTDLYRPRAQYVRAGDTIGYVGAPSRRRSSSSTSSCGSAIAIGASCPSIRVRTSRAGSCSSTTTRSRRHRRARRSEAA